jgi:hypothetical protein
MKIDTEHTVPYVPKLEDKKGQYRSMQASLLVMTYEEMQRNIKAFQEAAERLHIVA